MLARAAAAAYLRGVGWITVRTRLALLIVLACWLSVSGRSPAQSGVPAVPDHTGSAAEAKIEQEFLAVPDARLAGQHLRILTAQPHMAGTPGDRATANYVAREFRAAGLETEIVPYRVLLSRPVAQHVQAWDASGRVLMTGPTPEHVDGDPYENNPRITMPFNSSSASGDVTGQVVYANYGRLQDFDELAARHIDLHGKIVLCRYGANFRGVKVYLAEQRGALGVLIYSDPQDDGFSKGDPWPDGPWRPDTGVQYGSVQYLFKYPGDPETPGVASTLNLPAAARLPASATGNQPHIASIPISAHDAAPILQALGGPVAPADWQGTLPFRYHIGPGGVTVHLASQQNAQLRVIWDVIGKVRGAEEPDEWVIAGNHRDAWVYGAVDPNSGTAAMLEAVHGIGKLLRSGWRPRRTLIFCSWDAEEQGLIGSTEWVEQNVQAMSHAVAYFNVDVAVSGPDFSAAAVPSLKQFVRNVTRAVPSPLGGTVFEQWSLRHAGAGGEGSGAGLFNPAFAPVGDLGSGSDFTPFLQHAGVPSTDITSDGPYGVYHSVFDNFAWYTQNADPHFLYLQEMARVFGLEVLRMADADVLPYDYVAYAQAIGAYLQAEQQKANDASLRGLEFGAAQAAAARFLAAARHVQSLQAAPVANPARLNMALRAVETDLLSDSGLPGRPWYRHTIYAPGEVTGYAVQVLPGVDQAIDAGDRNSAIEQLAVLAQALNHAAQDLQSVE